METIGRVAEVTKEGKAVGKSRRKKGKDGRAKGVVRGRGGESEEERREMEGNEKEEGRRRSKRTKRSKEGKAETERQLSANKSSFTSTHDFMCQKLHTNIRGIYKEVTKQHTTTRKQTSTCTDTRRNTEMHLDIHTQSARTEERKIP